MPVLALALAAACSRAPRGGLGQQWLDALNTHDPEAVVKLLTGDATYWESGLHEPLSPAALRGFLAQTWKTWTDRVYTATHIAADTDAVVIEWHMQQVHPSGKSIPLDGVTVLDVNDGRIRAVRTYYDLMPYMQLLP